MLVEIALEHVIVLRTAVRAANRVDVHLYLGNAQTLERGICQRDDLRIGCRCRCAKTFHTELMMLAQTALLYIFVAVIRHDIVCLERKSLCIQGIFQICTDCGGSAFRTQSYRASALIGKRVHFLLYNVCCVADATVKQLRVLKIREANFLKTILHRNGSQYAFHIMPFVYLGRYNILGALRGFDEFSHKWLFLSGARHAPPPFVSAANKSQ